MRILVLSLFLVFPLLSFTQTKETAVGTYAENGVLVKVTNLTGLSECSAANISGKVGSVKVEGDIGHATVKSKDSSESIAVPLERLKPDERSAIFKQLVKKSVKVRIAGYRCTSDQPITAFSIDRVY